MRHFVARFNGCSVINDGVADFGSVLTPTPLIMSDLLPSVRVAEEKVAHLAPEQRRELLNLLDEFAEQFSDHQGGVTRWCIVSRPPQILFQVR